MSASIPALKHCACRMGARKSMVVLLSNAIRQRRRNGGSAFLRACASSRAALRRVRGRALDLQASANGYQTWSGRSAA